MTSEKAHNDYTKDELDNISLVKRKMYEKFNLEVSLLLNKIYDQKEGKDLLCHFIEIGTCVNRLNEYFIFKSEMIV